MHTFNLSMPETDIGGFLWAQGLPSLHSEFQARYRYIVRLGQRRRKRKYLWMVLEVEVKELERLD